MNYKLSYLLGFALLLGCYVNQSPGYHVIRKKTGIYGAHAKYQDYSVLVRDLQKVCDNALWDSATCAGEMALLPAGGRMVIVLQSSNWEEVVTTDYEYVIQDTSGAELLRQKGNQQEITNSTDQNGKVTWRSVDFMQIPLQMVAPFKFYIIDHRRVRRSEYLIKAKS